MRGTMHSLRYLFSPTLIPNSNILTRLVFLAPKNTLSSNSRSRSNLRAQALSNPSKIYRQQLESRMCTHSFGLTALYFDSRKCEKTIPIARSRKFKNNLFNGQWKTVTVFTVGF
jgi:hypothetical protein